MEPALFAILGLIVGAVINRIADNLPRHCSLRGAPACPYCGTPRPFLDQFATLSYLLLRGRCANCRAPIALRAPLVEIATAVAFVYLRSRESATLLLALYLIYTVLFLLVFVIDLEHRLIFNIIILPAIVFALVASPWSKTGLVSAIVGGLAAFAVTLVIYLLSGPFARARGYKLAVPFGQGDVTLATFVGIVTGFPNALTALVIAILLGGVGAIAFLGYELVVRRRLALGAAIPYGPFFCIAGWWMMTFAK